MHSSGIFLVFINEEGNTVADKAVDVAITYVKKNNRLGVNTDPVKVVGNRTDANGLLESRKCFLIYFFGRLVNFFKFQNLYLFY